MMSKRQISSRSSHAGWRGADWSALAALVVLAFAVRCIGIERRPIEYDELYHILAARSWAAGLGTSIAAGDYDRVRLFTEASGVSLRILGWSLFAARLPSVLAGAALVGLVFGWVRMIANRREAWIAAMLLCFSAAAIDLSQVDRFYGWHVVAIWVAAMQVYALAADAMSDSVARRSARSALALAAMALALYIQPTTIIAVVAMATGAMVLHLDRSLLWSRTLWLAGMIVVTAVAVLVLAAPGRALIAGLWSTYRETAPWAAATADRPSYYYGVLADGYGWLFHLLPLAMLLAWHARPRPALFCTVLFAVALTLQSFGGMKSARYISYLEPLMLVLWALALGSLAAPLHALLRRPFLLFDKRGATIASRAAMILMCAFAFLGVPAYRATASHIVLAAQGLTPRLGPDAPDNEDVDWTPYIADLRRASATSILVTADDLRALYYLGGYDLLLNRTVAWDKTRTEYGLDPRTGGHGITALASLADVVRCYPSGTILVSNRRWRSQDVTAPVADFIERVAKPVALPEASHLRAFVWRGPDRRAEGDCRRLLETIGDRRRNGEGRLVSLAR